MARLAAVATALAACGSGAAPAEERPAPVHAAPPRAPQRIAGTLAPRLAATTVYPTKVCLDGTTLVFENFCGCNDALLCHLERTTGTTLAFSLTLDPTRLKMCDDCFAMVPARCALPPGDRWTIAINGQTAFELGNAADGSCWTEH